MRFYLQLLLLLFPTFLPAQEKGLGEDISAIVFLDSFVVTASKQGFDVADFIDIVQQDESFFLAFHNLRLQEYHSDNQLQFFDKKRKIKAAYTNRIHQKMDKRCRTMDILEEMIDGNFFKNKKKRSHRYYTARMHHSLFFTNGTICETSDGPQISEQKLSGIEKHINELKKLIFQPGRKVDVPLIGGKTAIFKKEMLNYYDFSIKSIDYNNHKDCFVFTAIAKPEKRQGKTIIKYLETFFDKETFQVLGRNYHLKYSGVVSFDVKMKVVLQQLDGKYLPAYIRYDGAWKIPLQKREVAEFEITVEPIKSEE